jgi:hypothetical protein
VEVELGWTKVGAAPTGVLIARLEARLAGARAALLKCAWLLLRATAGSCLATTLRPQWSVDGSRAWHMEPPVPAGG